jgi:hypothetical protein
LIQIFVQSHYHLLLWHVRSVSRLDHQCTIIATSHIRCESRSINWELSDITKLWTVSSHKIKIGHNFALSKWLLTWMKRMNFCNLMIPWSFPGVDWIVFQLVLNWISNNIMIMIMIDSGFGTWKW